MLCTKCKGEWGKDSKKSLVGHRALNKESLPGKWYHCNAYSFRFNWFLRDFEVNCKTFEKCCKM